MQNKHGMRVQCGMTLTWLVWNACVRASPEYRLSEYLGQRWTGETISFPVRFEPGDCREVSAVTADGMPVVFQAPAADVKRHADGSLAAARIFLTTDLAPGQTIVFRALADRDAPAERAPRAVEPVRVTEDGNRVTLETARAGVRLPLGEFEGDALPGPYQGLRLTTGSWTGSSRLMGDPGPLSLKAEITERGPIFAEVVLHYVYPGDRAYTLRCRLLAGAPVALFSETFDLEPGARYHRNRREHPLRFQQGRFGYGDEIENSHWIRLALEGFAPDLKALERFVDRQKHASVAADDPWLATLHPWQSWHGGTHMLPLHNDRDYLGLMTLRAGKWRRPLENLIPVRQEAGEIVLQIPVNDGRREWGVHFGTPDAARPSGEGAYPHFQTASALRRARITHGETSLDIVKDWILSWEDAIRVPNPVSVHPPGDLDAVHARFAEIPELAEMKASETSLWQRNWSHLTEDQLMFPDAEYPGSGLWRAPDLRQGATFLYLATGLPEHARSQFRIVRALLDYGLYQTLYGPGHHGYAYGHDYGMLHMAAYANAALQVADPLLGSPYLDEACKAELRARLAFYGHLLTDPDYWPSGGIGRGNFNMEAAHNGAVGVIGAVLAGHPLSESWQALGENRLQRIFADHIGAEGVMAEGTHYSGVTVDAVLPFMALLRNAGGTDHFQNEAFKKGMRWYAELCPPIDIRFGRAYMPPYGYSHPTDTSQSLRWAVAGAMTAETDPAFSALMMDTWRRQGFPSTLQIGGHFLVGMMDPSGVPETPVARQSHAWKNYGAVMRAHAHTERETYLTVCDWGGWTSETGAFHLYAKGSPLSLVFGARAYFNPAAWYSGLTMNRVVFDRREEPRGTRPSGLREWVSLAAADFFGTEFRFTRLQGRAAVFAGDAEDPGKLELSDRRSWPKGAPAPEDVIRGNPQSRFGSTENVPPQTWQRRILFVKDEHPLGANYFLISDSTSGTLPTEWNLWVLAEGEPRMEDGVTRFSGRHGVDLDVYALAPCERRVTGAWGPDGNWGNRIERQRLLQFQNAAGDPYLALLYPRTEREPRPEVTPVGPGAGARVVLPGRTDIVLAGDGLREFEEGTLRFQGRGALVQPRSHGTELTLFAGSCLAWEGFALEQPMAGGLLRAHFGADGRITGESDGMARTVIVQVPDSHRGKNTLYRSGRPVVRYPQGTKRYAFDVPAGRHAFELGDAPSGADRAAHLDCMERQLLTIAAVLRDAQAQGGRLPHPSRWRDAVRAQGVELESIDGSQEGSCRVGYGWWLEGKTLDDFPNPAIIPALGDADGPVLGNSMGVRRHNGAAVMAFLDGRVSLLPEGCPQCHADDFADPSVFRATAGRADAPMTWSIFSGPGGRGNFHDVVTFEQDEMRAATGTDESGHRSLQLSVPAGLSATYAVLPVAAGLASLPARRFGFEAHVRIPDLSQCMVSVAVYPAPMPRLTGVMINGHNGLTLGPASYNPRGSGIPFAPSDLRRDAQGRVLRLRYATQLSLSEVSGEAFDVALLDAPGGEPSKGGLFAVPEDQGSCAASIEKKQLLGLVLGVHPRFGARQVERDVTVSFERLFFVWE